MKKTFTVVTRTRTEYLSNAPAATIAPTNHSTLASAKSKMKTNLATATVSFGEIYDITGVCARGRNPAGA